MIAHKYTDSSAQQEYRYDAKKSYPADVAIFQNGVITSMVEVCVSHPTIGESLKISHGVRRRGQCVWNLGQRNPQSAGGLI